MNGKRKAYGLPFEMCMLVKPDPNGDPYEKFLNDIPDLVPPDGRYDATEGRPNPLTVASITIRARRRVGKQPSGSFDRRRWSKKKYRELPPEAMYLLETMDRSRPKYARLETQSRPLRTGMSFEDWINVRSQDSKMGQPVPTRIGKDGRIPVTKAMTRKELKAWIAAYERLFQAWKKENIL